MSVKSKQNKSGISYYTADSRLHKRTHLKKKKKIRKGTACVVSNGLNKSAHLQNSKITV